MKEDIAAKLNRELGCEIQSERQVVYILVETRKLLERQGRVTLGAYPALKLCSDWAVHPKLRGPDAQEIIRHFDACEVEFQKSGKSLTEMNLEPLRDFISLTRFRTEFMQSLSVYGVNIEPLASDGFWQNFIQRYCGVIRDCPLEATSENTKLVTHVSALAWPTDQSEAIFPGKRVVQWNWTLRAGLQREKVVCALI
jgi:hypothetical protein